MREHSRWKRRWQNWKPSYYSTFSHALERRQQHEATAAKKHKINQMQELSILPWTKARHLVTRQEKSQVPPAKRSIITQNLTLQPHHSSRCFFFQKNRVDFEHAHCYKSLDDVSFNEQRKKRVNRNLHQPSASNRSANANQNHSCDGEPPVLSKYLPCDSDKTPKHTKSLSTPKRNAQHSCDRINSTQLNGIFHENKSPVLGRAHPSDELFSCIHSSKLVRPNFGGKSTNFGDKWLSTQSLHGSNNDEVSSSTLRKRIVCSLVLLEAFGNAADYTNANSSRFVSSHWAAIDGRC